MDHQSPAPTTSESSTGLHKLIEALRSMAKEGNNPATTHHDRCWEYHPRCAMHLAANVLEDYADELSPDGPDASDSTSSYSSSVGWTSGRPPTD